MSDVVTPIAAASALVDALAALRRATDAVNAALAQISSGLPVPNVRQPAAQRTTGTQILAILASAGGPLTLGEIADAVVALRRGEDEPKGRGGTRYGEMCRTSLSRLIERGLVVRVEPEDKRGFVRFARA